MTWDAAALQRHRPAVLSFLQRRVWCREAAEDLCQETFLRALRSRVGLRDATRLRSYLLRIAHNLAVDHVRRRASMPGSAADPERLVDEQAPDPARSYEVAELEGRLTALLAGLPPDLRQAFELGIVERRPYAEIAAQLGWSVARVKINVFRARRRLMAGLEEQHR